MSSDRERVVIIGAGGFGREVADVVAAVRGSATGDSGPALVGFLDDQEPDAGLLDGRPYLGPVARLADLDSDVRYVIAIGSGSVRRDIDGWARNVGRLAADPLVHPAATIGAHLNVLAEGVIVCAGVRITTNVSLGRHVHLNLNATVGHDAVLEDYVTVFPGVAISGNTRLETGVSMGTGSSIIQGRRVGAFSTIGSSASVVRDIPAGVTAVGVPARPLSPRS